MGNLFWCYFHSIMFMGLTIIWEFTEDLQNGQGILHNLNHPDQKKNYSKGETIVMFIIVIAAIFALYYAIGIFVMTNDTLLTWFGIIFGSVYLFIAIKQIIKLIFIPENRSFSNNDIKDFLHTYMFWCIMVAAISLTKFQYDIPDQIPSVYRDMIIICAYLVWYYFNILFVLGGIYILLYYLWILGKKLTPKLNRGHGKIKHALNRIYHFLKKEEKLTGLSCFRLWRNNKAKSTIYKTLMTIPMLAFDIWGIIWLIIKIFIGRSFSFVLVVIFDPIRLIYKCAKNLWNKHKNSEWMYLFAQVAGLCSYAIVFLIIQYGEYAETTKKIYEFAGTIIWIPYFISKIVRINKNQTDERSEKSTKEVTEHVISPNMTYNEDGEGVINGKTIRQLEFEAMQKAADDPNTVKSINNEELRKELRRIARNDFRKKVKAFIRNNIELLIGICISVLLFSIYFIFRTKDTAQNISMIGSIIGAEGAMLSVLLSITFMKKSNEKTLDASVLPFLTIEHEKEPAENAYAFEFIRHTDHKMDFSTWRAFDFDTIRNDKIKLVRNGIAYLHIKNIGIGPAIHLRMRIENFSYVYLPIDYLRPNDELYLILNFSNPDKDYKTDITFEYETIRGEKHMQRFQAKITWHLDRTNFTLFR